MRSFFRPASAPEWLGEVLNSIRGALSDEWPTPLKLAQYAANSAPPPSDWTGGEIYVPDEISGAVPAFSDGTSWRRVTDRAVIYSNPASLFFDGTAEGAYYDPTDISTLWKDTAGTVPVTAHGDAVARVDDLSGNGFHLIQATAANRPLYDVAGSVRSLLFDGTNDFFNITNCSTMLTGWTAASGAFAATMTDDTPAVSAGGVFGYFAASDGVDYYPTTAGDVRSSFCTSVRKVNADPGNMQAWHNTTIRSTANDFRYELNGTSVLSTAVNTFQVATGNPNYPTIGDNGTPEYFKGNLGRLVFINRILTDAEMANVRTSLAAGYA